MMAQMAKDNHLYCSVTYFEASRTLCIHAEQFDTDEDHFEIRFVTNSVRAVYFGMMVLKVEKMKIA